MKEEFGVELRVYSGIHAGASASLTPGRYLLGADPECDFVISDEGIAPQLTYLAFEDGDWFLQPLSESPGAASGIRLGAGCGAVFGAVTIGIDSAGSPWREPVTLITPVTATSAETDENDAQFAQNITTRETPADAIQQSENKTPPLRASSLRTGRRAYLWIGVTVVAILTGLLCYVFLEETPLREPVSHPPEIADVPSAKERVSAAIAGLALSRSAEIDQLPDGRVLVLAMDLNDEEYESVAAALSRIRPRLPLLFVTERQLIADVREALHARGAHYDAEYLGDGRFRVIGRVADDAEKLALLGILRAEFPAVRGFEDDLLTSDMIAQRLIDALNHAGAGQATAQWEGDVFVVTTKAVGLELQNLEAGLIGIDTRIGKWISFRVAVDVGSDKLPFNIRSVVSGNPAFIVLDDSSKVLVGGRVGVWRLAEIGDRTIAFDGPRRIVINR